ncbi:hypothetical protein HMPREF1013_05319 [Bacillus sp. 2_A_57_CT2]|nr:hypothetical protein HMPREF1013_05319 [Bacillus sp. 2_A_57_CT2]
MKYRKKPVVIEVVHFKNDEPETLIEIQEFMNVRDLRVSYSIPDKAAIVIETLEGNMTAQIGDYIIKGVNGEFYPCKPDIFEKTYELVEG